MTKLVKAEYEGITVSFHDDGWFNATCVATPYGKEPVQWLRQRETLEYMAALLKRAGKTGIVTELNEIKDLDGKSSASRARLLALAKKTGFVVTKQGSLQNGGGTWLHPKLAVRFAQWANADFAVWCDEQIEAILHEKKADLIDDSEPSTVLERTPLYLDVVQAVIRHRLMFPVVYKGINDAAGSEAFRLMTKKQLRTAKPFARRIANGTATPQDWQILDSKRKALGYGRAQPELDGFGPPALK
jgi:KilA-N domain